MVTCEEFHQSNRQTYGNSYISDLQKDPALMSAALNQVIAFDCKDFFNYDIIVDEFCADENNLTFSIGDSKTCQDLDVNGDKTSSWCLKKDKPEDTELRMKTRSDVCNKTGLKSAYEKTAIEYCKTNPEDEWCVCYNIHNNVCETNMNAAGCKNVQQLENNKDLFKDGYEILKNNMHCRPGICNRPNFTYIPPGVTNSCKPTYKFCNKDIDIRTKSNGKIAIECNEGIDLSDVPDWWDEDDGDDSWLGKRKPPFDRFPLNILPVTEFPKEFDWGDDNVKYLTYGSVLSLSLCSLCVVIIMVVFLKNKR